MQTAKGEIGLAGPELAVYDDLWRFNIYNVILLDGGLLLIVKKKKKPKGQH